MILLLLLQLCLFLMSEHELEYAVCRDHAYKNPPVFSRMNHARERDYSLLFKNDGCFARLFPFLLYSINMFTFNGIM